MSAAATSGTTGAQIGSKLWKMANKLRKAGVRPADYQAYILPILMFKVICDQTAAERDAVVAEHGEQFWNDYRESLASFDIPTGFTFEEQRGVAVNLGESLTSALVEIEKRNAELAGVFLGTDYARLDDERIQELYKILASVSFSPAQTSQDALGQAYEYLLGEFADSAGAKAGQFFTPPAVARLLAELVEPSEGDTVYDPTCGSGGLLNAAAERSAATGHPRSSVALFGQELDEQSFAIAKVNMFLHGNSSQVVQGDTLLDPKFVIDDKLRRFTCVVANPPFSLENTAADFWENDRFGRARWGSITRKPAELAFVAHIAQSMQDSQEKPGRAAIVLPMPALHRGGDDQKARELLLEGGIVDAVVALPPNLFFNTPIPASVLVLRATPRRSDGSVLFVDASTAFQKVKSKNTLTDDHVAAIASAVRAEDESGSIRVCRVAIADIVSAGSNLTVARWLDRERSLTQEVDARGRWDRSCASLKCAATGLGRGIDVSGLGSEDEEPVQVKLGEIAEFPTATHKHDPCTHPYLSFAGLRQDGTLDLISGRTDGVLTAPGDTVVSAQGHVRGWVGKKASRLITQGLVAATTLLVVRPIAERVLPEYLNVWLRSPVGRGAIDSAHGERTSAHRPTLKEIPVLLPSIEVQKKICAAVAKADAVIDAAAEVAAASTELHRELITTLLSMPDVEPRDE